MFTIYGGKQEFAQWDLNQMVTNPCMNAGDSVVFKAHGKAYETTAYKYGGEVVADVPNFMLQKPGIIRVDLHWGLDVHLNCRTYFDVTAQDKPEGYDCDCNIKHRPVVKEIDITESGIYDVTEYASANVNVAGGASVETCAVTFGLESFAGIEEFESVTYTALVDGAITTKTVKSTDANFFGTYNDVVKGTIFAIKAVDEWFMSSYGVFTNYAKLSISSDNDYSYYNLVINRDGSIDFMMD